MTILPVHPADPATASFGSVDPMFGEHSQAVRQIRELRQLLDLLRVLEALGKGTGSAPVLSAKQVAEKLDCSRQAADRKLRELEEENKVLKHELGPRSVAWTRRRARKQG